MLYRTGYVCLSVLIVFATACDSMINGSHDSSDYNLSRFSDEDIVEAKLLSLELSGELEVPEELWHRLASELLAIRSTLADEYGGVNTRFVPNWAPGRISVSLDDETAQQIADGAFHMWDDLNDQFGATFSELRQRPGRSRVYITFDSKYHPVRVAEYYHNLPGVRYAERSGRLTFASDLHARFDGDVISYLFYKGWGDCPSGCINREYWYVGYRWDRPYVIGHWAKIYDGASNSSPSPPDWWEEAKLNLQH
jgi:hypothetical protein